jgi:hypothetical protein
MSDQYRLVGLGNSELLAGLSVLVRQSNELTAHVVAHLVELEQRMLHLELGFSSLFAYCVEALGMSEGGAGRRVTAARVCRQFPEAFQRLARGELHLCALCALASHLSPANATQLFDACRGKTRRQIEELLAARFPRPDVREQIRRLPTRAGAGAAAAAGEQEVTRARASDVPVAPSAAAGAQEVTQARASDVPVAPSAATHQAAEIEPNGLPIPAGATHSTVRSRARASARAREIEPLAADRFGVHFTADAELRELIERARALASHRLPSGDLATLVKLMAASFVRQEEKRRFGISARVRRAETKTEANTSNEIKANTSNEIKANTSNEIKANTSNENMATTKTIDEAMAAT